MGSVNLIFLGLIGLHLGSAILVARTFSSVRSLTEARQGTGQDLQVELASKDPAARQDALFALVSLGDKASLPMIQAKASDPDPRVRGVVALALGQIVDPSSESALVVLLTDKSDFVRREAAWALGAIGSPTSVAALRQALADRDLSVRFAAAEVLKSMTHDEIPQPRNVSRGSVP